MPGWEQTLETCYRRTLRPPLAFVIVSFNVKVDAWGYRLYHLRPIIWPESDSGFSTPQDAARAALMAARYEYRLAELKGERN